MLKVNLTRSGNSMVIVIPPTVAKQIDATVGSEFDMFVESEKKRITLDMVD